MYNVKFDYKQKDGGLDMFEGGNGGKPDMFFTVVIMVTALAITAFALLKANGAL